MTLLTLDQITLTYGAHKSAKDGFCAMEAAAYLAREPHSDHPDCVCPVIAQFMRSWNDGLDNDDRNRILKPLILKVIGTRSTKEVELTRVMLCIDWLVREYTPAWLDRVKSLKPHATILRSAKPIQSWDDLDTMLCPLRDAQKSSAAASAAARAAARDAAISSARATLRPSAWDAAWNAAISSLRASASLSARAAVCVAGISAAISSARAGAISAAISSAISAAIPSARDAAISLARASASPSARAALAPTVSELQESAVKLVERMIAVGS